MVQVGFYLFQDKNIINTQKHTHIQFFFKNTREKNDDLPIVSFHHCVPRQEHGHRHNIRLGICRGTPKHAGPKRSQELEPLCLHPQEPGGKEGESKQALPQT